MSSSDRIVVRQNEPCEFPNSSSEALDSVQPLILSTPYARILSAPKSAENVPSPAYSYAEDSSRSRTVAPQDIYQSSFTANNYQASSDHRDYEGRSNSSGPRAEFLKDAIGFQSQFRDDNHRPSADIRDPEVRPDSPRARAEFLKDAIGFQSQFTDNNYRLFVDSGNDSRPNSQRYSFKLPSDSNGYKSRLETTIIGHARI